MVFSFNCFNKMFCKQILETLISVSDQGQQFLHIPTKPTCVLSSFAIIFNRKRVAVALLLLSYGCLVTVDVL